MREMTKQKIPTYTLKMRLYPSKQQRETMDRMLRALHVAYNITFHYVFQKDERVCGKPNKEGAQWPDYKKMTEEPWLNFLRKENPIIKEAPGASLSNPQGIFKCDAKNAWKKGMHKRPIEPEMRKDFHFYNASKPRTSFFVQVPSKKLIPSPDNKKVAWIYIPKTGWIKARGFNPRLCFGENGEHSYAEALQAKELSNDLSVKVSKDNCGSYYVSVTFTQGNKTASGGKVELFLETPAAINKEPLGVDMGVKEIATLSNGQKIENKRFLKHKQPALSKLNRQLSRRWGPANMAYRDYNKAIRQENRSVPQENRAPTAQPSRRYVKTQQKKAQIERTVARRRNTYYHQQTAKLVRQSSMLAMETLHVTNMKRNHKLAHALADAAMSDFLSKLKYKAEWYQIPVCCIGTFEPTSQLCSCCGEKNELLKNLSIRAWRCPHCGAEHDRDVNAARNILQIATQKGGTDDKLVAEAPADKPKSKKAPRRRNALLPDTPELTVVFSKELTHSNDPRYVIKNASTGLIIDDAQGAGYRSVANARNAYKAKRRWAQKQLCGI